MNLQQELHNISTINHLELLAKKVVEGFISGMHKSPFHGFSSEFSEHKIYNSGKAPSILIGNYLRGLINYTPKGTRKKRICVVISYWTIHLPCITL